VAQYLIVPKRLARAFPALEKAVQWLEAQAFRFIFWTMSLLSIETASRLAAAAFGLLGPLSEKSSKVKTNLKIAFPEKSEAEINQLSREVFRQLGMAAAELIKMPQIFEEWEERIELVVAPESKDYLEAGKPGVYISAHVGPWQIGPVPLIRKYFHKPMLLVYAKESNEFLQDKMARLREAMGVDMVPSEAGVRPLLKALKDGTSLALAVDTRLQTGKLIPFFGVEALTNIAPARMALRSGVPLVPCRTERLAPGKFRMTVQAPCIATDPNASPDEQAIDMTRQVNERFEEWIRAAPEQWMCLKRRWPKAHRL